MAARVAAEDLLDVEAQQLSKKAAALCSLEKDTKSGSQLHWTT